MSSRADGWNRLRPAKVDAGDLARFVALAAEIESCAAAHDDEAKLQTLLDEWNERAYRPYAPGEFTSYQGATSTEQFARAALATPVGYVDDLSFEEACGAMAAVAQAKLSDAETGAVLDALELNFPGANVSDLVFWPNAWFGDESLLDVELTPEQLVGYASARSGRSLAGEPSDLELPHPVPTKRSGRSQ